MKIKRVKRVIFRRLFIIGHVFVNRIRNTWIRDGRRSRLCGSAINSRTLIICKILPQADRQSGCKIGEKEGVVVVGFIGRVPGKLRDSKTSSTGKGITMDVECHFSVGKDF